MTRLDRRQKSQDNLLLESRYINQVLQEEGQDIRREQTKRMAAAGFQTNQLFSKRRVSVTDTVLSYEHLAKHRFIDMKRRRTARGVINKKNYPIHNRILFGHANNMVRRISFGFTDDVKQLMANIE